MTQINLSPAQVTLQLFPVGGTTLQLQIATGLRGAQGETGANGQGLPAGGTSNQTIIKSSIVDYDTEWADRVLDEDNFATNSATVPPSQQSTKVYVDAETTARIAGDATEAAARIVADALKVDKTDLACAFYATKAAVEATSVPDDYDVLRIANYSADWVGGGAFYYRVGSEPSHEGKIEDAAGAWWELDLSGEFNPQQFGAEPGNGGDTSDATAAFNNCTAAARLTLNATLALYQAHINLQGATYRCDGSIDLTEFNGAFGTKFGNGKIISHAADLIALDVTGSRSVFLHNLVLRGDESDAPQVGIMLGRISSGITAGLHVLDDVFVFGQFTYASIVNYGSEVNRWSKVKAWNNKISDSAYCYVFVGDDTGMTQVDSEFVASGHGEFSNIMTTTTSIEARRYRPSGIVVTGITQANPAVVTFTGTAPSNGNVLVFFGFEGMTEINDQVVTVANVTATTFELAGVNSSGYGAFTSAGSVFFKTGPAVLFRGPISAQDHQKIYAVTYGSYPFVLQDDGGAGATTWDIRGLRLDSHCEGAGLQALVRFLCGTSVMHIQGFKFYEHNAHTPVNVFSTDANGAGYVKFTDAQIEVVNFNDNPTQFFDNPSLYQFNGASELSVGEGAGLISSEVGKLLRQPDKIIIGDATYPVRFYNGPQSPAHHQIRFAEKRMFPPLSSSLVTAYNDGWLDRVGSAAGTQVISVREDVSDTYLQIACGAGTDVSDNGALRRGAKIFQPDLGEMMFEFGVESPSVTNPVFVAGFATQATTAALADADFPVTLNAAGTPTFAAGETDFAGICFDDTLTTKTWRAVANKASSAQAATTGIIPVINTVRYWRMYVDSAGNLIVFGSADNKTWSKLAEITNACTANVRYAPIFAVKSLAAQVKVLRVRHTDVRCLKAA